MRGQNGNNLNIHYREMGNGERKGESKGKREREREGEGQRGREGKEEKRNSHVFEINHFIKTSEVPLCILTWKDVYDIGKLFKS